MAHIDFGNLTTPWRSRLKPLFLRISRIPSSSTEMSEPPSISRKRSVCLYCARLSGPGVRGTTSMRRQGSPSDDQRILRKQVSLAFVSHEVMLAGGHLPITVVVAEDGAAAGPRCTACRAFDRPVVSGRGDHPADVLTAGRAPQLHILFFAPDHGIDLRDVHGWRLWAGSDTNSSGSCRSRRRRSTAMNLFVNPSPLRFEWRDSAADLS